MRMEMAHVQTKKEIEALLALVGAKPSKRFGQNFLIDGNLMRRLAASAELGSDDLVLEVGGGTGGLTDLLAAQGGSVYCVEIDRALHALLLNRFDGASHVHFFHTDVLHNKHHLAQPIDEALRSVVEDGTEKKRAKGKQPQTVKLVANLPYQIATPLLIILMTEYPMVRRYCFTVQAEVGERFTAVPHTKAYGPVSIIAQSLCEVEVIANLPPQVFWPRPTVDSVMIRMDVTRSPFEGPGEAVRFAKLLRGTFDHRRKTLRSALGYVISPEQLAMVLESFDGQRRPETLSVDEWLQLFRTVDSS